MTGHDPLDLESAFLQSIVDSSGEDGLWLILADWLDEQEDPRGELVRLRHELTRQIDVPDRASKEARLRWLLEQGIEPLGPRFTSSAGITFAFIAPGVFLQGSPPDEPERDEDEVLHPVTLTQGFWMGITPVTQGQWKKVMGTNPSEFVGDDRPVEMISWDDCRLFLRRLRWHEGKSYRLPTEAEWEYACRAGTTTPFHFGSTISPEQACYDSSRPYAGRAASGSSLDQTMPVGKLPPNAWGLHDMHGNVEEWCSDWHAPYLRKKMTINPRGPRQGRCRVLRGGCWEDAPHYVRAAYRCNTLPISRYNSVGVRLCLSVEPGQQQGEDDRHSP